ncbi:MAG TPA: DUF3108 domain-containing protein [Bacteroidales bacterium]|nr:DUF3108 domain-containing protein [Bacteroidales bacterium]
MMVKPVVLIFLLSTFIHGYGQFIPVVLDDKPYKAGEKLIFTIKFGPIIGGTASLILKQVYHNNKVVFHSVAEGKTVGIAEKLYSVKDVFESYFDINTLLPYRIIRNVKEGNYRKHEEALLNRDSNTVYSVRKDTVLTIPPEILDMVSLIYFIRALDYSTIMPGDVLKTVTYFDDELFPFEIRYKGKEIIKTKYGKIRCLRFDPVVEPGRMFKSEDDMTVWISDDRSHVPVKVRFDLLVGSLNVELDEYTNLKYPLVKPSHSK